jgi:hypothetical protein
MVLWFAYEMSPPKGSSVEDLAPAGGSNHEEMIGS